MKRNQVGVTVALSLMLLPLAARSLRAQDTVRCPDGDTKVVHVAVSFDRTAHTIAVSASSVTVEMSAPGPRRVCWTFPGLDQGETLRFANKSTDEPDYFPGLKRDIHGPSHYANSGNPSRAGTWTYGLQLLDHQGKVIAKLDPDVIIKP